MKGNHVVYLIVFLAAALRVHNFSSASIWNDEGITLGLIHKPLQDIIKTSLEDVNAPFYGIVGRFWAIFFGYSLSSIRFLSVLCSTLTTLVLFKLADKNFGRIAAIISCSLFCFSNLHIYYSEEARCYALLCLNASIALYYFFECVQKTSRRSLIFYGLFSTLAIYTQLFFCIQLAIQAIILFIIGYRKDKKAFKAILLVHIVIVFLFAFWFVPTFLYNPKVNISSTWIPPITMANVKWFFQELFNHINIFYGIVGLYFAAMTIIFLKRRTFTVIPENVFFSFLIAIFSFICLCCISYFTVSIFYPRYVLFTSIPLFISMGAVISKVSSQFLTKLILILVFTASIYYTRVTAFRDQEWTLASQMEDVFYKDNTCVVVSPQYSEPCYIYNALDWAYFNAYDELDYYKWSHNYVCLQDSLTFIERKYTQFKRVILFDGEPWRDDRIKIYLNNHYDSIYARRFIGVDFYVFDKKEGNMVLDTAEKGKD